MVGSLNDWIINGVSCRVEVKASIAEAHSLLLISASAVTLSSIRPPKSLLIIDWSYAVVIRASETVSGPVIFGNALLWKSLL
jgi:hypothetical protein